MTFPTNLKSVGIKAFLKQNKAPNDKVMFGNMLGIAMHSQRSMVLFMLCMREKVTLLCQKKRENLYFLTLFREGFAVCIPYLSFANSLNIS